MEDLAGEVRRPKGVKSIGDLDWCADCGEDLLNGNPCTVGHKLLAADLRRWREDGIDPGFHVIRLGEDSVTGRSRGWVRAGKLPR